MKLQRHNLVVGLSETQQEKKVADARQGLGQDARLEAAAARFGDMKDHRDDLLETPGVDAFLEAFGGRADPWGADGVNLDPPEVGAGVANPPKGGAGSGLMDFTGVGVGVGIRIDEDGHMGVGVMGAAHVDGSTYGGSVTFDLGTGDPKVGGFGPPTASDPTEPKDNTPNPDPLAQAQALVSNPPTPPPTSKDPIPGAQEQQNGQSGSAPPGNSGSAETGDKKEDKTDDKKEEDKKETPPPKESGQSSPPPGREGELLEGVGAAWEAAFRQRLAQDKGIDLAQGRQYGQVERRTGDEEPPPPLTKKENPLIVVERGRSQAAEAQAARLMNQGGISPWVVNPNPEAEAPPAGPIPGRRGGGIVV